MKGPCYTVMKTHINRNKFEISNYMTLEYVGRHTPFDQKF